MGTKLKYNYAFNNAEVVFHEMFTYLTCKQHDIKNWRSSLLTAPCTTWKIKGQLDATDWFLLQNLLSAQHASRTIMPIIRSARVKQMVAACGTWRFGLQVVGLVWSCRFMCPTCGMLLDWVEQHPARSNSHQVHLVLLQPHVCVWL